MGLSVSRIAICLIAAALFLPARASQADPAAAPAQASGLTIVDSRPAVEKTRQILSLWATSCDFEIVRLGDDEINPGRLALLQSDLEAALGSQLANATLTVTRYRIFFNSGDAARGESRNRGLVGALLTPNRCSKEKTTAGWYAPSEVTTDFSPIIIEIGATLAAKDYSVRLVYSPSFQLRGNSFDRPREAAPLLEAIHQANAALIDQLRQSAGPAKS